MKKTIKISLNNKGHAIDRIACGYCFSIVEEEDEYCWRCGSYFDVEKDPAYDWNDLSEYMFKVDPRKDK